MCKEKQSPNDPSPTTLQTETQPSMPNIPPLRQSQPRRPNKKQETTVPMPKIRNQLHRHTLCGTGKYSDEIRSIAVNLFVSDINSTFKSVATTINQHYSFNPPLAANTVNQWVTSRGLQHSKEQKMKNRVYWRTKKYPKYLSCRYSLQQRNSNQSFSDHQKSEAKDLFFWQPELHYTQDT